MGTMVFNYVFLNQESEFHTFGSTVRGRIKGAVLQPAVLYFPVHNIVQQLVC